MKKIKGEEIYGAIGFLVGLLILVTNLMTNYMNDIPMQFMLALAGGVMWPAGIMFYFAGMGDTYGGFWVILFSAPLVIIGVVGTLTVLGIGLYSVFQVIKKLAQ